MSTPNTAASMTPITITSIRLQTLAGKARLSEDEEVEEKRLKKEKLALKDRMEAIARHHREGVTH